MSPAVMYTNDVHFVTPRSLLFVLFQWICDNAVIEEFNFLKHRWTIFEMNVW